MSTETPHLEFVGSELAVLASKALQAARRASEEYRREQQRREQRHDRAERLADRERQRAERAQRISEKSERLAEQWQNASLAARWAAAEATRDTDPNSADAWSLRMREDGINPEAVITLADQMDAADTATVAAADGAGVDAREAADAGASAPLGTDVDAQALVAEALAESFVEHALDAETAPTPDHDSGARESNQRVADLVGVTDPAWSSGDIIASAADFADVSRWEPSEAYTERDSGAHL
ncbi:hypothetical protein JGU71_29080 [Antrihabitans sp. YC3-6]|uniref:Uncharacterized protein n=1 Tax=Antrihabitans stalagmiti TaxID=2799499 RepID=A0A934U6Y7_9NOCA|nr:hypothetical protein [Antrihabitans stalagmiti]MBJ8342947.1 hypothetical protein [Antrihabitans stalagmiti]